MKHRLSALATLPRIPISSTCRIAQTARLHVLTQPARHAWLRVESGTTCPVRGFASTARRRRRGDRDAANEYDNSNARPAKDLNDNITQEEKDHFAKKLREDKGKQIRTPWHREGSDVPPVHRQTSASAMTKGELG